MNDPSHTCVEHGDGRTILTLGIVGLVCCGLCAPIALVLGFQAREFMRSNPTTTYSNAGEINAGWILGIVGSISWVLGIALMLAGAW